jgi:hypothetical protein
VSFFTFKILFIVGSLFISIAFLGWVCWSLFWHLYDEHMRNARRIANSKLDSAWTTKQFHAPYSRRDFK